MRKYKRKRKKITVKKLILFFTLIILLFLVLGKVYLRSPLIVYAKQKSTYYASLIINDAVSRQIVPNIDTDKIISLNTNNNGYITSVVVDVHQINLLISEMTKDIHKTLLEFQNDENHELHQLKIPFGAIFNNPLLIGLGPDLKINLRIIGSVHTDIISTAKPYGINNSLIEVSILTRVKFQVAIPFQRDEIDVETHTPLLIKVIQGRVPQYYYKGGSGVVIPPPGGTEAPIDNLPGQ